MRSKPLTRKTRLVAKKRDSLRRRTMLNSRKRRKINRKLMLVAQRRGKRVGSLRYEITDAVIIYPDGREVCRENAAGNAEYDRRRDDMAQRQNMICADCGDPMRPHEVTFDHEGGRGSGGSRRDDRIVIDGKPHNAALHWWCNTKRGSSREPYKYQAVTA